jgi:MarR family transcriptional regulator, organic hydroperoxide resistance regulator
MSQGQSRVGGRRSRPDLIAAFDREARRMGSMATLHNHAVAEFAGLHQTDQECIDLLDWTGPLTAGEIGAHLGLSSGAVTGLIDRLEAGGWVLRTRDQTDRRRVIVRLAGERSSELWPVYRPLAETLEAYREGLDGRDLRILVEFLEFANESLAEATRHARRLRAGAPQG